MTVAAEVGRLSATGKGMCYRADYEVWARARRASFTARPLDPPFAGKQWITAGLQFASFDMTGEVTVRITSKLSLRDTIIRPVSAGVTPTIDDDHRSRSGWTATELSIEPDGRKGPLLLFAIHPKWIAEARCRGSGLLGREFTSRARSDRQRAELYGGCAVVTGGIIARGETSRSAGAGSRRFRLGVAQGATAHGDRIHGSSRGSGSPFAARALGYDRSAQPQRDVRNVKLCNSRVQNDAGQSLHSLQDVLITDCFIRSDDGLRGHEGAPFDGENNNVERITVENCFSGATGPGFLLGQKAEPSIWPGDAAEPRHHPLHDDAILFEPARTCGLKRDRPGRFA